MALNAGQNSATNFSRVTRLRRVLRIELTGNTPTTHRLAVSVNERAKEGWVDEVFGKRMLVTTHEDQTIADVVAAYRSRSDAEFGFRQFNGPRLVWFSP